MRLYSACLLIVLGFVVAPGGGVQRRTSPSGPLQFNRAWFENSSYPEVNGFLNGYYDCLPNADLRALPGWNLPTESMVEKIAAFYKRHPSSHQDVPTVAISIASSSKPPKRAPNGEVYRGRHGYFDGLWWKTGDLERLGYVEGYLACLGRRSTRSQAQRFANFITGWYTNHPYKEDRPIALVLQEFLNQKGRPQRPGNKK